MSYPAYPEYKNSGVEWLGDVPAHWDVKRLSHYFDERREKASDVEFAPLSVTKNGVVPRLETAAKTQDGDNRKKVCGGDFVINSRSDRKGSAGLSPSDGTVSLICIVLKPKGVEGGFIHHLLRSAAFQEEFYRYGKGIVADLWSTGYSEMKNIVLALPSINEQKAIATFLDHETARIDALVEEQQRLIALLKEKRQAVISHAVTKGLDPEVPMKDSGVEWLGEVPEHWEVKPLKRAIVSVQSGTSVNAADVPAAEGELGVLKTSCVYKGWFDWRENKTVNKEDLGRVSCPLVEDSLIVSRMNTPDLVGSAGLVIEAPFGIFLPDRLWQVLLQAEYSPKYLHYFTRCPAYRDQVKIACAGTSSSMQNLGQDEFGAIWHPTPPEQEQIAIATFLDCEVARIESLIKEGGSGIGLLQERRSALISAAVTGKIDVRGWQPPEGSQAAYKESMGDEVDV